MPLEYPRMKENSKAQYNVYLKIANGGTLPTDLDFIKNKALIMERIEKYSSHTKKSILSMLQSMCKVNNVQFRFDRALAEAVKNLKNKNPHDDNPSWEQVLKIRDDLPNGLEKMVLSLYTYLPPRRNKDYAEMIIVNKRVPKDEKNYLWLSQNKFVFRDYKTAGSYGEQMIDIPKELRDIINKYIGKSTKKRSFLTENGKEFPHDNTMTYVLNRALGQKVGSSQLRHIFLRKEFPDDAGKRKEFAESMAHSIGTQLNYIAQ
jgi:hypothetical protein